MNKYICIIICCAHTSGKYVFYSNWYISNFIRFVYKSEIKSVALDVMCAVAKLLLISNPDVS